MHGFEEPCRKGNTLHACIHIVYIRIIYIYIYHNVYIHIYNISLMYISHLYYAPEPCLRVILGIQLGRWCFSHSRHLPNHTDLCKINSLCETARSEHIGYHATCHILNLSPMHLCLIRHHIRCPAFLFG